MFHSGLEMLTNDYLTGQITDFDGGNMQRASVLHELATLLPIADIVHLKVSQSNTDPPFGDKTPTRSFPNRHLEHASAALRPKHDVIVGWLRVI